MHLRYSEMFYSLQGEGRFVGVPSVFLRTFGCNFSCHGFGQPRDRSQWLPPEQMPHQVQDLSAVQSLEDLPVVSIGCCLVRICCRDAKKAEAHTRMP